MVASAQTTAAVGVDGLSFRYGERVALDGVSFSAEPGEIFGLLGPNGSGKTTLFRILSTLIPPQQGTARIFGHDLRAELNEVRRAIGVVFQAPSLDKKLTAAENLRHQGHLYGLGGAELSKRIEEMLARVGLSDRAHDYTEKMSGGQRRRVELAKGLLHRPKLLLLDEPSTGLDPGARRDLMQYLKELSRKDGVTSLLTTHLMEEAEQCSRLGVMRAGKLVALDTPEALKARIGGHVVTIKTRENSAFAAKLKEKLGVEPAVVDDAIRVEQEDGHSFVARVVEAFPGEIESVAVSKPTLEDVFVHLTGHRFWEGAERGTEPPAKQGKH
ncbi:MAG: ATP-binding cassette domain-containing protein [Planctomycetota bacterium]|nr:ATP-binding cassette domain-containing protein [Planctomycetota bacterium]